MINILLRGVDEFLASHVSESLTKIVKKIIPNQEIIVTCLHSTIYHNDVDQTSFHMIVTYEMNKSFVEYEKRLVEATFKMSREFSVHCHVNFKYLDKEYDSYIDDKYPLYVDKENEVLIQEPDQDEEVYTGDIFLDFENLTNKK